MLETIITTWGPIAIGAIGFAYGLAKRVSRKEFDLLVDKVELITTDGEVTPEEFLNTLATALKAFRE